MGRSGSRRNAKKEIIKSRFWSGLKSYNNNRLTLKNRDLDREANQDPNVRVLLRAAAQVKRNNRKLKNIELKLRGG